ncbi:hypothetical protein [Dyadobacter sp. CY323]|uniref:hypothetical protein n=1 Tax=Dyadobacter sp. CY323 TaxID=2907302 RepID=UPI001F2BD193|nr:hypothetical protein [Dyadobacter sp. CY323]MCE6991909.1 hypothetical protein [Dyadobacter sp. CY323]
MRVIAVRNEYNFPHWDNYTAVTTLDVTKAKVVPGLRENLLMTKQMHPLRERNEDK